MGRIANLRTPGGLDLWMGVVKERVLSRHTLELNFFCLRFWCLVHSY